MVYFLILIAIGIITLQNICLKEFNKNFMKNYTCYFFYNSFFTSISVIILGFTVKFSSIHNITIILGIAFGFIYVFTFLLLAKAFETGPYAYTNLLFSFSLIVPLSFGLLFLEEKLNFFKIIGLCLLVVTLYLGNVGSIDVDSFDRISKKWVFYCVTALLLNGLLMTVSKGHQVFLPGKEINEFSFIAFLFSMVVSGVLGLFRKFSKKESIAGLKNKYFIFIAIVYGVFCLLSTRISLSVSGKIPAVVQFPMINGGIVIASIFVSIIIYKEKFTNKKVAGFCVGLISLILLGIG